jgi:hypothetical protein
LPASNCSIGDHFDMVAAMTGMGLGGLPGQSGLDNAARRTGQ